MKLIILLSLFIVCKSLIKRPIFCEKYNCLNPTLTILSNNNADTLKLLSKLKKHKINHVFMDIQLFNTDEIDLICKYHLIDKYDTLNKPLIFDDNYKYINSIGDFFSQHLI